jgi:hypothetical protein
MVHGYFDNNGAEYSLTGVYFFHILMQKCCDFSED